MKDPLINRNGVGATRALVAHRERCQSFRQTRAGSLIAELKTDSAMVDMRAMKTDFGFAVQHRANRFHDAMLERLAGEVQAHAAMCRELRHEATLTVNV